MSSMFDLSTDALAVLLSDDKGLNRAFLDIGVNYDDCHWLDRAKMMYEETLKMNRKMKPKK